MRLLTVVGARPQFIKAGPVSRAIAATDGALTEFLVHTGQHYDDNMSQVFFDELSLPEPDVNLGIGPGPHGQQTGRMLEALEGVMVDRQPDAVLVYGDTNSTLAGAVAAAKLAIPLGHVEAGMRSHVRSMPEEINRVVADHVSTWLFCSSSGAVEHLAHEGLRAGVHEVGDVMRDALDFYRTGAQDADYLAPFGVEPGGYDLLTVHRAGNTVDAGPLFGVLDTLAARARPTLFPVHPRTRPLLDAWGGGQGAVRMVDPVSYRTMLALMANAGYVLTDSGGMQKEAYWLGVPCITLRAETEWVETLAGGWNRLAPMDARAVTEALAAVEAAPPDPAARTDLYGNGHAAEQIVDVLLAGAP